MESLREIAEKNQIRAGVNLTDEDLKRNFIEESVKEGAYYYKHIKENEEKIETEKRQRDIELYCRKSLITPKVLKGKFENVVLNSKIEEKYYKRLLNYCKVFDEVKEDGVGILLTGNPGTGKSFYTSCIYNQLKNKYKVYRFNFSFYLETLKKDFNEIERLEFVRNADLIIIDDLGNEVMEKESKVEKDENTINWRQERLFNLIQEIYENEIPVIISSNLTYGQLNKFLEIKGSDKLMDRLVEQCKHFHLDWESRRAEVNKTKFQKYFSS